MIYFNNFRLTSSLSVLVLLGCIVLMSSCRKEFDIIETMGMAPVYINKSDLIVESQPPREFGELGHIVVIGDILLINELYTGIHVVDNSDQGNPVNIAFWAITGNLEFTVTGDLLYADNSLDLYTIDISNIFEIELVSTQENIYSVPESQQFFPRNHRGYFECVNPELGIVIDWEEKFLVDPKCRRP